ncbi:MAG: LysR substrate-binding domain-containing protein [Burkholderiaceae bacterium]
MTIKLNHLRDLLAVVEKGSINSAARHLGTAQPALSRSIRDLEKDLGVPLLERHSRGAVLTPMGEIFVRRATAAVTELRRARDEIQQLQGEVHGTVVACLSSLAHVTLLPWALQPFTQRYPNVRLHIIEGVYPVVEAQLKNGAIDFYVGPPPESGPAPELQLEKLFDNTRVVLARKAHPLVKSRSLGDLGDVRWITTRITSHDENELGGLFARFDLPPPRLALRADSALTWITALAHTDMMSISPRQWLESPMAKSLLAQVPIKEALPGPPIVLIRRSAVPPTPAAEYLCDMVRRAAVPHAGS